MDGFSDRYGNALVWADGEAARLLAGLTARASQASSGREQEDVQALMAALRRLAGPFIGVRLAG